MECIRFRSRQAAILVLNWVKHSSSLWVSLNRVNRESDIDICKPDEENGAAITVRDIYEEEICKFVKEWTKF